MPRGRPSKFKPHFCDDLIAHMSEGGSYETFGAFLGKKHGPGASVSEQTLYDWEKQHPEFLDAKKRGFSAAQEKLLAFWSLGKWSPKQLEAAENI